MTTLTSSQIDWKRFSLNHIQRESGGGDERNDYDEYGLDMQVTSPTHAHATSRTMHRQSKQHGHHAPKSGEPKPSASALTIEISHKEQTHEQVNKTKTRAARAIEETPVEELSTDENAVPPEKKEKRSDYWVQRDEERRSAARTFKIKHQSWPE
jgi:hypothetical protein